MYGVYSKIYSAAITLYWQQIFDYLELDFHGPGVICCHIKPILVIAREILRFALEHEP